MFLCCAYSSMVEQETHNFLVIGSNPVERTKEFAGLA